MNNSAQIIDGLGGPKKVAELLGIMVPGAIQRVSNWKRRGIPSAVVLQHQDVFHSLIWPDIPEPRENPHPASTGAIETQRRAA